MTRSNARELTVHLLYELDYTELPPQDALAARLESGYFSALAEENDVYAERPSAKQRAYIASCVNGASARFPELDEIIAKFAIGWNLHRISRFTKAALRLAIYEILYVEDVPTGVAINECVELTRKYEEEETVAFVNGVLGSFSRSLQGQTE